MTKQELMALSVTEEAAEKIVKAMVPYDRFAQVNNDNKALKEQLAERDKSIETLKDQLKHGEDAQKTIDDLQAQIKTKDASVLAARKDAAIQVALAGAKAKNAKAAMALLDMEKLELAGDGSVKGLKEALEALQRSDGYLFDAASTPAAKPGFNPTPAAAAQQTTTLQDAVKAYFQPSQSTR